MLGGLDATTSLVLRRLVVRHMLVSSSWETPRAGGFVLVPDVAIAVIEAIQAGQTLGEAAESACQRAGQPVDVLDFAGTLVERHESASADTSTCSPSRPT